MSVTITLPYPPLTNNLYITRGRHRIKSPQARVYRDAAGEILLQARVRPVEAPVVVWLDVYRPRRAGDLDGAFKAILDALTGFAYVDDKQVVEIHARRFDDKHNPRVEVRVEEVQP